MDKLDVAKLLALVKGNWYQQPTTEETVLAWSHILADINPLDAFQAALSIIKEGGAEPPTAGKIYQDAMEWRRLREAESTPRVGYIASHPHKYLPGTWIPGGMGSWYLVNEDGVPCPARAYARQCRLAGEPIPPLPQEAIDAGYYLFTELEEHMFKHCNKLLPGETFDQALKRIWTTIEEFQRQHGTRPIPAGTLKKENSGSK
jgi:hypothetical protein